MTLLENPQPPLSGNKHQIWMQEALNEANKAFASNEVPIGAIVVYQDEIVGRGFNSVCKDLNPSLHAEMNAVVSACQFFKNYRLPKGCTLYSTLEPCVMCAGVLLHARVSHLVYACKDEKAGGVESLYKLLTDPRQNHLVKIEAGVLEQPSKKLLQEFFQQQRTL